jgi:hypothetical protein
MRKFQIILHCHAINCTKFLLCIYAQSDRVNEMKRKIMSAIPLVAVFVTLGLLTTTIPAAHAQTVTSTATILGVRGLVPTPLAIVYGSLTPNAESADQTLALLNSGNVGAVVSVRGTHWSTLEFPDAMLVGATRYSLEAGQAYATKIHLTDTDAALTTIAPVTTVNTYWQLKAVLNQDVAVGPAIQTLTFTTSC